MEIALPVLGVLFSISELLPLINALESNGILDMCIRFGRRICISYSEEYAPLLDSDDSERYTYNPRFRRSDAPSPTSGEFLV